MNQKKLKVIVLTHANPTVLVERLLLVDSLEIECVFVETKIQPERSFSDKLKRSVKYDGILETVKKALAKFAGKQAEGFDDLELVSKNQNDFAQFAERSSINVRKVESFHSVSSKQLIRESGADIAVLYGTNIIKESVFSIPRLGSINIHQGLAPEYRGGPSVFWELFNGEKEVGVTVHFVAAKVDTGDIILQKTFPLEYDFEKYEFQYEEFVSEFRSSLKISMIEMIIEALTQIASGTENRSKQDTSRGKRYRLPVKSEKDAMLRVLEKRYGGRH